MYHNVLHLWMNLTPQYRWCVNFLEMWDSLCGGTNIHKCWIDYNDLTLTSPQWWSTSHTIPRWWNIVIFWWNIYFKLVNDDISPEAAGYCDTLRSGLTSVSLRLPPGPTKASESSRCRCWGAGHEVSTEDRTREYLCNIPLLIIAKHY